MKLFGIFFYSLAGLGCLVAFSNVFKEMNQMGSDPNGPAGLIGYAMGSFLLPLLFLWAGSSCMKKANDD